MNPYSCAVLDAPVDDPVDVPVLNAFPSVKELVSNETHEKVTFRSNI